MSFIAFEEVKQTEVKVEPKKISIENKEYTTKTGRQKVTYENGQLVVRDIKTGKEVSAATRKKAIDEYVDAFDFEKGKFTLTELKVERKNNGELKGKDKAQNNEFKYDSVSWRWMTK